MVDPMEMDILPIIREPLRVEDLTPVRYITPDHVILLSGIEEITAQDAIFTSICWTLKWRPAEIPEHRIIITPDLAERLRSAQESRSSDQVIAFLAMAGLMTLAKEIRTTPPANYEYLRLRWKALCATLKTDNIIDQGKISNEIFMGMMQKIISWQNWIKPQGRLRYTLLNLAIKPREREPFVRGLIDQVIMIIKDFGLKSAYLMESLVTAGNKAVFIPTIARQAQNLRTIMAELRERYQERFPYLSVYPLEGIERIHHRNFPDLYYAAVKTALQAKALGVEGRYIMTDVQTTVPKTLIDSMIEQKIAAKVHPTPCFGSIVLIL